MDANELLRDPERRDHLAEDPKADATPMHDPNEPPSLDETAPTFASSYGPSQLERDRTRQLVSLARLPGWPGDTSDAGHGWGLPLNEVLGGGICPGYMLAVGAAGAGMGKTAWIMQVADGLALRTAELVDKGGNAPLTPVLILSEMGVQALTWRTLARWTGHNARVFRAGHSADDPEERDAVRRHFEEAADALSGPLGKARAYMRALRLPAGDVVRDIARDVTRWKEELTRQADGREVWPVVVVDPIQRWQREELDEVQGLNVLAEGLRALADDRGAVVFLTSDTNKPAAASTREAGSEGTRAWATGLFRGSYKLQHAADAALALWRPAPNGSPAPGLIGVLAKNRWGGLTGKVGGDPIAWRWATEDGTLRFTPATQEEVERWKGKGETAEPTGGKRRGKDEPPDI